MKTLILIIAFLFQCGIILSQRYSSFTATPLPDYEGPSGLETYYNYQQQQAYNKQIEKAQLAEQNKKRAVERMTQVSILYDQYKNNPVSIIDGWHNVTVSNNIDFCDERKVYVQSNKIIKYLIDNTEYREISFSSTINSAKAIIKIIKTNGMTSEFLTIYFIEDLVK